MQICCLLIAAFSSMLSVFPVNGFIVDSPETCSEVFGTCSKTPCQDYEQGLGMCSSDLYCCNFQNKEIDCDAGNTPEYCRKVSGTCTYSPCETKDKELGMCGENMYCCNIYGDELPTHRIDPNIPDVDPVPNMHQFILTITALGPETSFTTLVEQIQVFLTKEDEIMINSLDMQRKEMDAPLNPTRERIYLIVIIKGQGTDSGLKRLINYIYELLSRESQMTDITLSIQAQGIDISIKRLIENINIYLRRNRETIDIPPNPRVQLTYFTLNIKIQGTKEFLAAVIEKLRYLIAGQSQIVGVSVDVQYEDIQNGAQGGHFIVRIRGQGTQEAIKRFKESIEALLREIQTTNPPINIFPKVTIVPSQKVVQFIHFTLNIKIQGTEEFLAAVIEKLRYLIAGQSQISGVFVDVQYEDIQNGAQGEHFIVRIRGQGTQEAIKRLKESIEVLLRQIQITNPPINIFPEVTIVPSHKVAQVTHFTVNIKVHGTKDFVDRLIKEINYLIAGESQIYGPTVRVQSENDIFIVRIEGQGIQDSVTRLQHNIIAFLKRMGQLIDSSINIEHEVNVGSFQKGVQFIRFTLKIEGQGSDVSVNILVQAIKALLNREVHTSDYSLNQENNGGYFILTLTLQGSHDFLNRIVQEILALVRRKGKITESFLHIKVNMFGVSSSTRGTFIVDSTQKCFEHLGTCRYIPCDANNQELGKCDAEAYCCSIFNRSPKVDSPIIIQPNGQHFILTIKGYGTEASFNSLILKIHNFLIGENEITDSSINLLHQEMAVLPSPTGQGPYFIVRIEGQGTSASLRRLIMQIRVLLEKQNQITFITLSIQGQWIDTSIKRLITELNVFLSTNYKITDAPSDQWATFTVKIQGQGTPASVKRLINEIKALFNKEAKVTPPNMPRIDETWNQGDRMTHFMLVIKIQGSFEFVNRVVQGIKSLLEMESQIMDSTVNIEFDNPNKPNTPPSTGEEVPFPEKRWYPMVPYNPSQQFPPNENQWPPQVPSKPDQQFPPNGNQWAPEVPFKPDQRVPPNENQWSPQVPPKPDQQFPPNGNQWAPEVPFKPDQRVPPNENQWSQQVPTKPDQQVPPNGNQWSPQVPPNGNQWSPQVPPKPDQQVPPNGNQWSPQIPPKPDQQVPPNGNQWAPEVPLKPDQQVPPNGNQWSPQVPPKPDQQVPPNGNQWAPEVPLKPDQQVPPNGNQWSPQVPPKPDQQFPPNENQWSPQVPLKPDQQVPPSENQWSPQVPLKPDQQFPPNENQWSPQVPLKPDQQFPPNGNQWSPQVPLKPDQQFPPNSAGINVNIQSPEACYSQKGICKQALCTGQLLGVCGTGIYCCGAELYGHDVSTEDGRFTLTIKVKGTADSVQIFAQEIEVLLKKENEIINPSLNVQSQGIEGSIFILTIKGQGSDAALNRLLQAIHALLNRKGTIIGISIDLQGQGIADSLIKLIKEINISLNKQGPVTNNLGEDCIDIIQYACMQNMGNCRRSPCQGKEKDIGSCGPGFYCCKRS